MPNSQVFHAASTMAPLDLHVHAVARTSISGLEATAIPTKVRGHNTHNVSHRRPPRSIVVCGISRGCPG